MKIDPRSRPVRRVVSGAFTTILLFIAWGCGTTEAVPQPSRTEANPPVASRASPASAEPSVTTLEAISIDKLTFMALQGKRGKELGKRQVRRSIGLTTEQHRRLAPVLERHEKVTESFQTLDPKRRAQRILDTVLPVAEELERTLDNVLTAEQDKKLFRIVIREQRGAIALLLPGVPEVLDLSDSQQAKIESIVRKNMAEFGTAKPSLLDYPRLIQMGVRAREQALSHLTAEQTRRWQQLLKGP